jgi:FAD-dependent oxidoreductase domain-containing protein 1
MRAAYDVVIIGGAAIGAATAFFLTRQPGFTGSILVLEKDPGYTRCSTTLSLASIRQQFSTPVNVEASKFGAEFIKSAPATFGERGELSFREQGYLVLAGADGEPALRANHELQISLGADNQLMTPAEMRQRFPWLATEGVALGCLGLSGEGWFDPHALLNLYIAEAKTGGAEYANAEAIGFDMQAGKIAGVRLATGETVACGAVVNASGIRADSVAGWAGLSLPVEPRKRIVYVFDCREKDQLQGAPLLFDPSGVYCRPEGQVFLCGLSPPEDQDPACDDFEITHHWFDEVIWPTLAHRVPLFEAIKPVNAWAGHYAYNTLDQNALLGPLPDVPNLYFVNGFSGHGVQQSPAVGRGIAELIAEGRYLTLDLSDLSAERLLTGRAIREANVY